MVNEVRNQDTATYGHLPVLYHEVLATLLPHPGGRFIDGTVGAGGHAEGILAATTPNGRLLGLDRDPEAIAFTGQRLAAYGDRLVLICASFGDMATVAPKHGFSDVDGILLDLGLSSRQLNSAERGFSFMNEGPLDMRFDTRQGETAADLINNLSAEALAEIFWRYGEEQDSRRIARLVVANRPITTTRQLAELIERNMPSTKRGRGRIRHPATRIFQALRIATNDELTEIERGLQAAVGLLKPEGRVAVISFHSLEDRMVKQYFRAASRNCVCPPGQPVCTCNAKPSLQQVTRKAIQPTSEEIGENPRSRSARLRVAARVSDDPYRGTS